MGYLRDYAELKEALAKVLNALETQDLEPEFRAELERHARTMIATLAYTWHPNTWTGWAGALAIIGLGLQQAWVGNYEPLIWWVFLPAFSPRIRWYFAHWRQRIWR